jgi:hypothetical protein
MKRKTIPTLWTGIDRRSGAKVHGIVWERGNKELHGADYIFLAGPLACTNVYSNGKGGYEWWLCLDGKPLGKHGYTTFQNAKRAAPHFKAVRERMET